MSHSASVSAATRQQFGAAASDYVVSSYHATGADLATLVAAGRFTGTERVIDVGTGGGHTAFAVSPHVASVVGIDLTPEMVTAATAEAARRGLANVSFKEADATALPFDSGTFDVVTNRQSAHHYADPAAAASEAARVLKPGGVFLLIDTISPEDAALDTFLNCVELLRDASHVRDWRPSEWLRMLDHAGFDAEVSDRFTIPLEGDDWTRRMRTPETKTAMIRELFATGTPAQRSYFEIRDTPWGFTLPAALFRAVKRG
jgi:SAM-dependent methyltransferase